MRGFDSLMRAMRLEDVPRPVLAVLAFLLVIACSLGMAAVRGCQGTVLEADPVTDDAPGVLSGSTSVVGDGSESSPCDASGDGENPSGGIVAGEASSPSLIYVHICGSVVSPGVYALPAGSRLVDALDAAGGSLAEANLESVNLAQVLADGSQIRIPSVGEEPALACVVLPASSAGGTVGAQGKVNVNTAGIDELQSLPGIGPSLAQAIVTERSRGGAFASVDELTRVSGIGQKKLDQFRDLIGI